MRQPTFRHAAEFASEPQMPEVPIYRVPLYMDIRAICENLCCGERTIDNWVHQGVIPPPRHIGGKRLWKTSEVMSAIDGAERSMPLAQKVYEATLRAEQERSSARKKRHPK